MGGSTCGRGHMAGHDRGRGIRRRSRRRPGQVIACPVRRITRGLLRHGVVHRLGSRPRRCRPALHRHLRAWCVCRFKDVLSQSPEEFHRNRLFSGERRSGRTRELSCPARHARGVCSVGYGTARAWVCVSTARFNSALDRVLEPHAHRAGTSSSSNLVDSSMSTYSEPSRSP